MSSSPRPLPHTPGRSRRAYSSASSPVVHDPFPPHSHAHPWINPPVPRAQPDYLFPAPRDDSDTARYNPYHAPPVDAGRFPGPLRVPSSPRFLASPPPSPHIPTYRRHSLGSQSPPPPPPYTQTLPPIRRARSTQQDPLPHLFPARWTRLDTPPRFRDSPSPTPSSPASDAPRYEYPAESDRHTADTKKPVDAPACRPGAEHAPPASAHAHAHASANPYPIPPLPHPEGRHSVSVQTTPPHDAAHRAKPRFGAREGARFYCTYVSPRTGARCATWDKGWTVYATLLRHAEIEHAPEELELLARGALDYARAQVVGSRERQARLEARLASAGHCPDCGTVFASRRRDSQSRHKLSGACEKAQKRGRPPTKFPKKPKGTGVHEGSVLQLEDGASP